MTEEQKAKCHKIADHYSQDHQKIKAIEEMAELQAELTRDLNFGDTTLRKIINELADVNIMMEQLAYFYDRTDISLSKFIDAKLERQLERMERENDA